MDGTWTPKLDDTFRLALPAECRDDMGEEVVIVCAQERCLSMYPGPVFDAMMAPIDQAPSTLKKVRDYQRWIHSHARRVKPDKQGRITLNAMQRVWASLDRDIVIASGGNHLEVWNPLAWMDYIAALDDQFSDFDGVLVPGGAI
ncbi:MAG: cell division/cell wall cluster transcriptional repressor MraZ [Propionibacteriaceae bacterium]|jgi:MraZ protein|nr:cell division/cell wall cluster transcriptional repressor MraZ [Propionibacteriaceae bacterium]